MSMSEERKIIICTNPENLRQLADKMESQYRRSIVGDTCFVDFLGYSSDLHVCLHLDQEWFIEQEKKNEQG